MIEVQNTAQYGYRLLSPTRAEQTLIILMFKAPAIRILFEMGAGALNDKILYRVFS